MSTLIITSGQSPSFWGRVLEGKGQGQFAMRYCIGFMRSGADWKPLASEDNCQEY